MKPPAIAVDRILALQPPSLRLVVPESWADSNGHMNMRWSVAIFDDAADRLHERAGLTREFHKSAQHGNGRHGASHAFSERGYPRRQRGGLLAACRTIPKTPSIPDVSRQREQRRPGGDLFEYLNAFPDLAYGAKDGTVSALRCVKRSMPGLTGIRNSTWPPPVSRSAKCNPECGLNPGWP